jgi:hypothetical protein
MNPYAVESAYTAEVGGGEVAAFTLFRNGQCMVVAFDIVALYASVEAYNEAEAPLWSREVA